MKKWHTERWMCSIHRRHVYCPGGPGTPGVAAIWLSCGRWYYADRFDWSIRYPIQGENWQASRQEAQALYECRAISDEISREHNEEAA